jgi:predicted dienelactone hydrolase
MRQSTLHRSIRLSGISLAIAVGIALPAKPAERIQFFYGPFEPTIYVEDLEQFAADGTVPERLRPIASRFDDTQLESIRELLNTRYPLNQVAVSQFTYGAFGEQLLYELGQLILTDSFLNSGFSLRASLLLATAEEPDCCTLLHLLEHFPLETIQIDIFLVQQVIQENQRIFQLRDEVIAGVREIAVEQVQKGGLTPLPGGPPHLPGPGDWQKTTFTFQNPDRSVPSTADLYMPSDIAGQSTIPVVVISHGIASDRETLAYLAEHLASHGYGVVALEHAETSAERFVNFLRGMEGPPSPEELINRPRDITAALDTLEQRAIRESALQPLNLQAVGVLGQSLGGYTALAAGGAELNRSELEDVCRSKLAERPSVNVSLFLQCRIIELPEDASLVMEDSRVQAVVAVNPVTSSLFGEAGLSQLQTPVMVIGGSDDYFSPMVPEQIMPFTWFTHDESYLVVMEQGTHFSFLGAQKDGVFPVPQSFIGPDPELARPYLKGLSLAFFNRYLLEQFEDEAFLTQVYLDTMNQAPFQFNIMHNFFE